MNRTMTTVRIAVLAAFLGATGVALAGPVHADLNGRYASTATSEGETHTRNWLITPCGPGCITVTSSNPPSVDELHQQGTVWAGAADRFGCTTIIDEASMTGTYTCPGFPEPLPLQITKVG